MDDDLPDDPDVERSEHDRELYAAVLFRIKQNLEKLALERGKPAVRPEPEENSN